MAEVIVFGLLLRLPRRLPMFWPTRLATAFLRTPLMSATRRCVNELLDSGIPRDNRTERA